MSSNMSAKPPKYQPGITVGVLGAGQLGRMLALAGYPLGLRFRFLDPTPDAPAGQLAEQVIGDYHDTDTLAEFAAGCNVITYEFENVPVQTARFLDQHLPVFPPPPALQVSQDRLIEKQFFNQLGIPTSPFAGVDSLAALEAAVAEIGLPAVLKTRRFGYDGKGQAVLRKPADLAPAWAELGGVPLILEAWLPFDRELSIIVATNHTHSTFYPLVENHHRDGILRLSIAPAPELNLQLQQQAHNYATSILTALNYVGVFAIELFQLGEHLLANEMAPRVHNSGHWTIEGAATSQFDNHLRAIVGLPLGSTAALGHSAMLNIIGELPDLAAVAAIPYTHLHLYGKQPRPNRKLGHVTLTTNSYAELQALLPQLQKLITPLGSCADR